MKKHQGEVIPLPVAVEGPGSEYAGDEDALSLVAFYFHYHSIKSSPSKAVVLLMLSLFDLIN